MRTQRTAQMSKGFAHPENQNITIFIRINPFLFLIFCQRPQFLYFCNVIFKLLKNIQSHPVWVRGLKPSVWWKSEYDSLVAPRVGAWIET